MTTETGQTVEVTMPQMGVSVAEGEIIEWRKEVGDSVSENETICDATTDKVDVEIPAPVSGTLMKILAEAGVVVEVGTVIAEIDSSAGGLSAPPSGEGAEESLSGRGAGPQRSDSPVDPGPRSRFYSPVVRRIAAKHGLDLSVVTGTGVGGRIRKQDIIGLIDGNGAGSKPVDTEAGPVLHSDSPYQRAQEALGEDAGRAGSRREPMSSMRQAVARHMLESRRTSAHVTTVVEVDLHRVVARRQELKQQYADDGISLTYLAFIARAVCDCLKEFPVLNASINGSDLVLHDSVHLGVAVALEPDGLIVPVIRNADRLNLGGMAEAIADVASRARSNRLTPDDVSGGTFTLTNPGQFGAILATPI
ncbi:MAG: 2-oxo acid dehydrogenase subunit E2, partial [Gemmatimonas sp.]|nr:2-oxo acid dehydrogenase subunit E2 [Gemmatimonas sp.]